MGSGKGGELAGSWGPGLGGRGRIDGKRDGMVGGGGWLEGGGLGQLLHQLLPRQLSQQLCLYVVVIQPEWGLQKGKQLSIPNMLPSG